MQLLQLTSSLWGVVCRAAGPRGILLSDSLAFRSVFLIHPSFRETKSERAVFGRILNVRCFPHQHTLL